MKSVQIYVLPLLAATAAMQLIPAVAAHGDDMDMDMGMDMGMGSSTEAAPAESTTFPPTYFAHPEHAGVVWTHIILMVVAWIFVLPTAVMLSLARSRYTLFVQFVFLGANAFGVLLAAIYNASTPDLYPNNAHHKIGWIATAVVCAQAVIGLLGRVSGALKSRAGMSSMPGELQSFMPISHEALTEHRRRHGSAPADEWRISHDSGQGTERNTASLHGHSRSTSTSGTSSPPMALRDKPTGEDEFEDEDIESGLPALPRAGAAQSLLKKTAGLMSSRVWKVMLFGYNFVDRTILPLGFIALCTGIIAFGRFFEGSMVFTGLAHGIKGGIFFWLGIFTLGRWAGSFGDLGWAWNIRPCHPGQKWRPSAELIESALIFTYGSTNIFLEHLGNWGEAYSAEDLEHISVTVLFFGGGLLGMLVESIRIRDLLNTTVIEAAHAYPNHDYRNEEQEELKAPRHYQFPINPIPALIILLLGIMMSSHTQTSMISSMIHKQWGNLLSGASLARGLTYVLLYLKPPKSVLPSRPPTELLASFGLIAGGIIFMASSGDTVDAMIHYEMDAMFMYTVTMGFVGLLMAWVILLIALKGWAVRKEAGRPIGARRMA